MIISISGFISSGKDTVANYLVSQHGFTKLSFAAALKDAMAMIFGWDRKLLEGDTPESREWRETVDTWWANRLSIPHLTPRWILQHVGTNVLRQYFHDDIWLAALENRVRTQTGNIVISDCRFPNEVKLLKSLSALIIQVKRGPDPSWSLDGLKAAFGDDAAIAKLNEKNIHKSEWAWLSTDFDSTIYNDSTLVDLYLKVNALVLPTNNAYK